MPQTSASRSTNLNTATPSYLQLGRSPTFSADSTMSEDGDLSNPDIDFQAPGVHVQFKHGRLRAEGEPTTFRQGSPLVFDSNLVRQKAREKMRKPQVQKKIDLGRQDPSHLSLINVLRYFVDILVGLVNLGLSLIKCILGIVRVLLNISLLRPLRFVLSIVDFASDCLLMVPKFAVGVIYRMLAGLAYFSLRLFFKISATFLRLCRAHPGFYSISLAALGLALWLAHLAHLGNEQMLQSSSELGDGWFGHILRFGHVAGQVGAWLWAFMLEGMAFLHRTLKPVLREVATAMWTAVLFGTNKLVVAFEELGMFGLWEQANNALLSVLIAAAELLLIKEHHIM